MEKEETEGEEEEVRMISRGEWKARKRRNENLMIGR